ncbi:hypothetical protein J7K43_01440, partial [Candidatus Calescamantes bacterium]|nr:hypothetical protein [Candidatus Calescamantes bacterium]
FVKSFPITSEYTKGLIFDCVFQRKERKDWYYLVSINKSKEYLLHQPERKKLGKSVKKKGKNYEYLVYSYFNKSNPRPATREEVERLRKDFKKSPNAYDIWFDAEQPTKGCVYVRGKRAQHLTTQTKLALWLILKKVGGDYDYEYLLKKLQIIENNVDYKKFRERYGTTHWKRALSKALERTRKTIYGVLDDYVELNGYKEKCYIYKISNEKTLKYCLIEPIEETSDIETRSNI